MLTQLRDLVEGLALKELTQRAVDHVEHEAIAQVLRTTKGNKTQAARLLQINYKTLDYKMKEYGFTTNTWRQ